MKIPKRQYIFLSRSTRFLKSDLPFDVGDIFKRNIDCTRKIARFLWTLELWIQENIFGQSCPVNDQGNVGEIEEIPFMISGLFFQKYNSYSEQNGW